MTLPQVVKLIFLIRPIYGMDEFGHLCGLGYELLGEAVYGRLLAGL
jgi:hypothetical protein